MTEYFVQVDRLGEAEARLKTLEAHVARLKAALREHGQHDGRCALWANLSDHCTCGLDQALKEPV